MKKITINDIVKNIELKTSENTSAINVADVVDLFLKEIKDQLILGNSVMLWDFGNFHLKRFKSRKARDINSGEIIIRPERDIPKFKFSTRFLKNFK